MAASEDQVLGGMEVEQQQRTYHGFLIAVRWAALAHVVAGTFFVMFFAAGFGLLSSALTAILILIAGIYLLRDRKKPGWTSAAATPVMTTYVEAGDPVARQVAAARSAEPVHEVAPDDSPPAYAGLGGLIFAWIAWALAAFFVAAVITIYFVGYFRTIPSEEDLRPPALEGPPPVAPVLPGQAPASPAAPGVVPAAPVQPATSPAV